MRTSLLLLLALLCKPCAAQNPADALYAEGRFPEALVDSDRDGVNDIDDNCPATAPMSLIRGRAQATQVDICGCPIDPCTVDADRDGVMDCDDLCPGTARGLQVTAAGCPQPQKRPQAFVLDVKFAFAEANLQSRYVPDLDQVRVLLLRFPEMTVTLEGNTDSDGSAAYNQALSQARANACRKYLLSDPRIAPARVRAIGFGEQRPVASNADEAGRTQNRRSVATLRYHYQFTPPNNGRGLPP